MTRLVVPTVLLLATLTLAACTSDSDATPTPEATPTIEASPTVSVTPTPPPVAATPTPEATPPPIRTTLEGEATIEGFELLVTSIPFDNRFPTHQFADRLDRVYRDQDGQIQVETLVTAQQLGDTSFRRILIGPTGQEILISVCESGNCGGFGPPDEDAFSVFHRSTDGGHTWSRYAEFDGGVWLGNGWSDGELVIWEPTLADGTGNTAERSDRRFPSDSPVVAPPEASDHPRSSRVDQSTGDILWRANDGTALLNANGHTAATFVAPEGRHLSGGVLLADGAFWTWQLPGERGPSLAATYGRDGTQRTPTLEVPESCCWLAINLDRVVVTEVVPLPAWIETYRDELPRTQDDQPYGRRIPAILDPRTGAMRALTDPFLRAPYLDRDEISIVGAYPSPPLATDAPSSTWREDLEAEPALAALVERVLAGPDALLDQTTRVQALCSLHGEISSWCDERGLDAYDRFEAIVVTAGLFCEGCEVPPARVEAGLREIYVRGGVETTSFWRGPDWPPDPAATGAGVEFFAAWTLDANTSDWIDSRWEGRITATHALGFRAVLPHPTADAVHGFLLFVDPLSPRPIAIFNPLSGAPSQAAVERDFRDFDWTRLDAAPLAIVLPSDGNPDLGSSAVQEVFGEQVTVFVDGTPCGTFPVASGAMIAIGTPDQPPECRRGGATVELLGGRNGPLWTGATFTAGAIVTLEDFAAYAPHTVFPDHICTYLRPLQSTGLPTCPPIETTANAPNPGAAMTRLAVPTLLLLATLAVAACTSDSDATPTTEATPTLEASPTASASPTPEATRPPEVSTTHTPIPLRAGEFTEAGPLAISRSGHVAVPLKSGLILIVGGYEGVGSDVLTDALLYDPTSDTFSSAGDTVVARTWSSATLLADGRVLIIGGATGGFGGLASAEIYDPVTGTFTATGDRNFARYSRTSALLPDGRVLVAGGGPEGSATAELFDPATDTFTRTGDLAIARLAPSLLALANGRVLVSGGGPLELFDPATGTFRILEVEPPGTRPTATLLDDGRVLFVGGSDRARVWAGQPNSHGGGPATAEVVIFDPTTEQLSETGSLLTARQDHAAVRLADGRVLIGGGAQDAHYDLPFTPSAEIYDPVTGTFSSTGAMLEARVGHSLTLLPDGSVLAFGISSEPVTVITERYLPTSRDAGAAFEPPRGRILFRCTTGWCAINSDGTNVAPLAGLPSVTSFPALSPDGAHIAYFEHDPGGTRWLGVARPDGSEARRLTEVRPLHDPVPPVWSPDSQTLYVERGPPPGTDGIGGDTDILAVDVDSGAARLLVDSHGYDAGPQVSPDGTTLVYMHETTLYTVPVAGGEPLRLTDPSLTSTGPTWLGNDQIVFLGLPDNPGPSDLYIINSDRSGGARPISGWPSNDVVSHVGHFAAAVSPDSEWIAFQSDRGGTFELYIVRSDSSELRQLTFATNGSTSLPSWSADSSTLAYSATIEGEHGVWLTRVADRTTVYLTEGSSPHWLAR